MSPLTSEQDGRYPLRRAREVLQAADAQPSGLTPVAITFGQP